MKISREYWIGTTKITEYEAPPSCIEGGCHAIDYTSDKPAFCIYCNKPAKELFGFSEPDPNLE